MKPPTKKMIEAVRVGCTAADVHLRCSYPECSCSQIPRAIGAAVEFAARDVAKDMKREIADSVKEAMRGKS